MAILDAFGIERECNPVVKMNQASGSGVEGSGVPPPPQHHQMQDSVGLAAVLDPEFVMLRNITRDKISQYIESKQPTTNLGRTPPELSRQLEEILFKIHRCKTRYYNMAGELEEELQIAIKFMRDKIPQDDQLSRHLRTFPYLGTEFDPLPRMAFGIHNMDLASSSAAHMVLPQSANMGLASSSAARIVLPQSANMGSSFRGKYPDKHMNARLSPGMNCTPKSKVIQPKEVPREPKFSCPVCMNEFVDASSTICGHLFCAKCIKASIKAQSKCPTCRKTLILSDFHRVYLPTTD